MKRILSMLMTLALLFTIMPAVLAADEDEITVATNATGVYDITDVRLYTTETVTGVTVNGTAVAADKITAIEGGISIDAGGTATLGAATVVVESVNGFTAVPVTLYDFIDYTDKFRYGQGTKVDFNSASTTNSKYFGFYYMGSGNDDVFKKEIDTAEEVIKFTASAVNVNKKAYVRMPEVSSAIRPEGTTNTNSGVGDGKARYVDLCFYADVKTSEINSKLTLGDVNRFSIGVDIFGTNGKLGTSNTAYEKDTWYTIKAHINSANGLFEVFAKQRTDTTEFEKIYERTEDVSGSGFKTFELAGYATSNSVVYRIDNLYYQGSVAQLGFADVSYVNGDNRVSLSDATVPVTASAFELTAAGSYVDSLSNIHIEKSDGTHLAAAVSGNGTDGKDTKLTYNTKITVTPEKPLEDGESYRLTIDKGINIDNAETEHERVYPFTVAATEFTFVSPAASDVISVGDTINLSCVAPGAETVMFTVNGSEIQGTKAVNGCTFNADFVTTNCGAGTTAVTAEATNKDGKQLNYEKRYVKLLKSVITNVTASNNWVQISGASTSVNKNAERINSGQDPTDQNANGWRIFYTATNTAPTNAYVFQDTTLKIGYTGRVSMSFDMKVETTTDIVNYKVYGNKTDLDMSLSKAQNYDAFPGLFNSNGKFYTTDTAYEANKWYKMKVVFDLDEGTKALYVDGSLLAEEPMIETFKCIGFARAMVLQTNIANRTQYAAMNIDSWTVDCEGGLCETAAAYGDLSVGAKKIVPETADTLSVTFNRKVTNTNGVKLYVNGAEQPNAIVSAGEGSTLNVNIEGSISAGDTIDLKIPSGTTYALATKVDSSSTTTTTDISATTDADVVISFVVGNENLLYVRLASANKDGKAGAVLSTANDGEAVSAKFVCAVYADEQCSVLKSVKFAAVILTGDTLTRLTDVDANDGEYTKIMLWQDETLQPLAKAKAGTIS